MRHRRHLVFLALACSCIQGIPSPGAETRKLRVLTSFLPIYCFTANVAGDAADVENLLPANVEPHDYQFSRKDLQKVSQADLIIINGLGLERWLEKAVRNAAGARAKMVVETASGLSSEIIYSTPAPRAQPPQTDHAVASALRLVTPGAANLHPNARSSLPEGGVPNPHVWLDPRLACNAVTNILRALQHADPSRALQFGINARRYLDRLEKLDAVLAQALSQVKGASIVTYHDAFPYFARRYGLSIIGVIEPVPEVEPSLKYLAALYRSIRNNHVQAIFTEPPAPSRLARQIGGDLRLPLVQLDTLESGPLNRTAYEEVMATNALVLVRQLKAHAE